MHSRIQSLTKVVLICLAILTCQVMSPAAQAQRQGTVTTSVNLRAAPGMNTQIVAILRPGDAVEILDERQGWLQVTGRHAGVTYSGWVYGDFIRSLAPATPPDPFWQEPELAFPDQDDVPQIPLGGQTLNVTVIPGEIQAPKFPLEASPATEPTIRDDSAAEAGNPTSGEPVATPAPAPGSDPILEVQIEAIGTDGEDLLPPTSEDFPTLSVVPGPEAVAPDTGRWNGIWLPPVLRFMAVTFSCLALGLALKAFQLSRYTRKRVRELEQRIRHIGAPHRGDSA